MASYNKVILAGNITRDFEMRSTGKTAVAGSGLAINRKYDGGEEVTFIDITVFGKTAEAMSQYLHKGSNVLIEGRLHLNQWTAQDGGKRSKIEVIVENFQFLDSKPKGAPQAGDREYYKPDDDAPF